MIGSIIMEPAPMPPYWPAYPEPERSRLEKAYRDEHAAYCERMNRRLKTEMVAAAIGFSPIVAVLVFGFLS